MLRNFFLALLLFSTMVSSVAAQSGVKLTKPDHSTTATNAVTIPAGTMAKIELQYPLDSKLNEAGDEVIAALVNSIFINNVLALPRGTEFRGRIKQITSAKRPQRQASMTIVFDKVITPVGVL